jgi:hypothetical protein
VRTLLAYRSAFNLAVTAMVGTAGVRAYPFPTGNVFLSVLQTRKPELAAALGYLYTALWFSTPFLALSLFTSLATIAVFRSDRNSRFEPLPSYPNPETRGELFLVLGEQHRAQEAGRSEHPTWLTIPRRGLHTGMMILGAVGTGKTSACMYPYVDQLLAWRAGAESEKVGGLILEVKGDFCAQVRDILRRRGREADYVEIGLDSIYCYNPLHNELEPYALAYSIATLLNNLYGRGKEPFWQQAYTDLVKFVILLRKVVDGYTTLSEVYHYALDESLIERDLQRGEQMYKVDGPRIRIAECDYQLTLAASAWPHWSPRADATYEHPSNDDLIAFLISHDIDHNLDRPVDDPKWADKRHQLEAVKRWYYSNWTRLEPRLRSSIVEGIVVFLSLFDDNPEVSRAFCPPKSAYSGPPKTGQKHGTPLPRIEDLLESGKVVALNFPIGLNPALARALGVMLKLDFQRAVLGRIPRIAAAPEQTWRDLLFVCDEYHSFATTGDTDPSGDERTFALSRQARLIPIVATQSISSLRSAVHGEESWRTLLQCFRTKVFLATSDDFTAKTAAELCGRAERLKPSYQLTEAGQDARVSLLTGRAAAHKSTVTASKHYAFQMDYVFQPKTFSELQNAQAIVLPYDGLNPHPPTYCYLKPHYLDVHTSYFDHLARGVL